MVKCHRMPIERHADPATGLVRDLSAKLGENVLDVLEIDVCTDGMGEKRVQNFAVPMVHVVPQKFDQ